MDTNYSISWFLSIPSKMVSFISDNWQDEILFYPKVIVANVIIITALVKIYEKYLKRQRRKKWNALGKDVVVLHGFKRGTMIINASPFVIKIETFLRMAGIKYEFDTEEYIGEKTKTPWISINGEEIADSDIIMDFLKKKFNVNFSKNLSDEQSATSRTLSVMADEHMFWGLIEYRYRRDPNLSYTGLYDMGLPFYLRFFFQFFYGQRYLKHKMDMQGIGFHKGHEIDRMMMKNIEAISKYLGTKKFLMGDAPCEVDCGIFGAVAQFLWTIPGSTYERALKSEFKNLSDYCYRMRDKFYPDWDQLLLKY